MAEVVLVDGDGVVWHLPNNRQMCHHWGGGRIIGGYDRFGDSDTDIGVMMEPDSFRGGIFMVSNVLAALEVYCWTECAHGSPCLPGCHMCSVD